jgi:hypothetical protein
MQPRSGPASKFTNSGVFNDHTCGNDSSRITALNGRTPIPHIHGNRKEAEGIVGIDREWR